MPSRSMMVSPSDRAATIRAVAVHGKVGLGAVHLPDGGGEQLQDVVVFGAGLVGLVVVDVEGPDDQCRPPRTGRRACGTVAPSSWRAISSFSQVERDQPAAVAGRPAVVAVTRRPSARAQTPLAASTRPCSGLYSAKPAPRPAEHVLCEPDDLVQYRADRSRPASIRSNTAS